MSAIDFGWGFKDWLSMVRFIDLPRLRFDVMPDRELLTMLHVVGIDAWEAHVQRLERHVVQDHWPWPEVDDSGGPLDDGLTGDEWGDVVRFAELKMR